MPHLSPIMWVYIYLFMGFILFKMNINMTYLQE